MESLIATENEMNINWTAFYVPELQLVVNNFLRVDFELSSVQCILNKVQWMRWQGGSFSGGAVSTDTCVIRALLARNTLMVTHHSLSWLWKRGTLAKFLFYQWQYLTLSTYTNGNIWHYELIDWYHFDYHLCRLGKT